jgi:membrane associated rhomboid family serine protease
MVMGIYDREYYRRDGPGFLGSFSERGQVCKWLIGINVVCFILQLVTLPHGQRGELGFVTDLLGLDVDAVLHGEIWRLLTYAFVHAPGIWEHIVFNMLFLWWFGSDVEDIYGSREFLAIYLLSAVLGGVAFVLTAMAGLTGAGMCLGASGAVTAVMVLCALHYPTRVILLFFILPVPIWLFVGFQVLQDTFIFLSRQQTGTAVTVHLAGALFAFVYYQRHWRVLSWWAQLRGFLKQRTRPRLRIYREEPRQPAPVTSPPVSEAEDQLEAKLDAVLEKVARYGQASLTESERQILLRASEVYKRRRL